MESHTLSNSQLLGWGNADHRELAFQFTPYSDATPQMPVLSDYLSPEDRREPSYPAASRIPTDSQNRESQGYPYVRITALALGLLSIVCFKENRPIAGLVSAVFALYGFYNRKALSMDKSPKQLEHAASPSSPFLGIIWSLGDPANIGSILERLFKSSLPKKTIKFREGGDDVYEIPTERSGSPDSDEDSHNAFPTAAYPSSHRRGKSELANYYTGATDGWDSALDNDDDVSEIPAKRSESPDSPDMSDEEPMTNEDLNSAPATAAHSRPQRRVESGFPAYNPDANGGPLAASLTDDYYAK